MSVDDVADRIVDRVTNALGDFMFEVTEDIRGQINTPYPPASDPLTPPHRRTGKLQANQESTPPVKDDDVVTAETRNPTFYAKFLENGTVKMAKRPFIEPAKERHAPRWRDVAYQAAKDP